MLRKAHYRPPFMRLEDRSVPGTVLTRPDLSAALGTTLAQSLDLTSNDVIAVASYEAHLQSQSGVDLGDHTTAQSRDVAPIQNTNQLVNADPLLLPSDSLNGDNGQNLPPPPAHRQYIDLGFLDGSFIQIGTQSPITFGSDPPTEGWTHVSVNPHDKLVGNSKHFNLPPYMATALGYHFNVQLEDLSKLTGTYDPTTGNSSTSVTMDVYITSPDAPSFDNMNCKVPATTANFTTDAGTPFSTDPNDPTREIGTAVDNTFAAQAIPNRVCGVYQGLVDYAQVINSYFGLPSASGNNTFSLHVSITPAIGP